MDENELGNEQLSADCSRIYPDYADPNRIQTILSGTMVFKVQTDKEIQNLVSEHKNTVHAPNFFALRNLYISH